MHIYNYSFIGQYNNILFKKYDFISNIASIFILGAFILNKDIVITLVKYMKGRKKINV